MKNTETQRHKGTKARIQCFFTARLCAFVSLCLCVFPYSFGFVPNMFGAASTAPPVADCDRECLRGFITQYLNAMLAHSPGTLPVNDKVRLTEDTVEMRLGEGLWKNASRLRPYRQDILDVKQGVAAATVIVEEEGSPGLVVVRLKITDKKITEVETQVTRNQAQGAIFAIDALQSTNNAMAVVPEPSQRNSREEAIKLAQFYPAGLKIWSFVTVDAPFAPNAYRLENGRYTAGPPAANPASQNMKTQRIIAHPAITTRVAAVDEELGIVLLRMNFGDTGSYGSGNALIVWEAFKIYGGQIHAGEAFNGVMAAGGRSGWG